MRTPESNGPFQLMYVHSLDDYHAVALCYTWVQLMELVHEKVITEGTHLLSCFFAIDLSNSRREFTFYESDIPLHFEFKEVMREPVPDIQ